jgi:hypothetical protein
VITILDEVEGGGRHDMELRLHINPELTVELMAEEAIIRDGDITVAAINSTGPGRMTTVYGRYCPEFGRVLPAKVLVVSYAAASLPFQCGWNIRLS